MKKTVLFLGALVCGVSISNAQDCQELFISEYVEGSGNDKAVELYNPTNASIDLTGYTIERFSNASSTSSTGGVLALSGSIAPYSTFVITNGQTTGTTSSPACSPTLQAMADLLDGAYPAPTYMNGNDAIALFKNSVLVDVLGKMGDGSMSTSDGWGDEFPYDGSVGAVWTKDHTLTRKSSVLHGVTVNPDPFIVSAEWDSLPENTWTGLGVHTCDCFVGINEIESTISFAVYPNPSFDGKIEIQASEMIAKIEMIDLLGQVVFEEKTNGFSNSVSITNSTVGKGIYNVRITYINNLFSQTNLVIQ